MNEKEQLWYARYLDYIYSGLPQQRWCREHGIPQASLRYWCNKFESFHVDGVPLKDQTDLPDISLLAEQLQSPGQFYELVCSPQAVQDHPSSAGFGSNMIRISHQNTVMEFPDSVDSSRIVAIAKGLIDG